MPIRILCCMLCPGLLEIAVCFQLVNNNCLFLVGRYPSEFYVACCVVGVCQKFLFASSRSLPIRILCCILCCGYLQDMAVCFWPVHNLHNSMLHVVSGVVARTFVFTLRALEPPCYGGHQLSFLVQPNCVCTWSSWHT